MESESYCPKNLLDIVNKDNFEDLKYYRKQVSEKIPSVITEKFAVRFTQKYGLITKDEDNFIDYSATVSFWADSDVEIATITDDDVEVTINAIVYEGLYLQLRKGFYRYNYEMDKMEYVRELEKEIAIVIAEELNR